MDDGDGDGEEQQLSLQLKVQNVFIKERNIYKARLEGEEVIAKKVKCDACTKEELSNLRHCRGERHIIRYYCFCIDNKDADYGYLVTEAYDYTLESFVRKNKGEFLHNNKPSYLAQNLIRDIAYGVWELQNANIIHGNLTPWKIAVLKDGVISKICDLRRSVKHPPGVSKNHMITEFNKQIYISAKRGDDNCMQRDHFWQAPEQYKGLVKKEGAIQGFNVDVFNIGCLFAYIFIDKHLFGEQENGNRKDNIKEDKPQYMHELPSDPTLCHLISGMTNNNPFDRWTITNVIQHPFFWSPVKALMFLTHASDYLHHKRQGMVLEVAQVELNQCAETILGEDKSWHTKIDKALRLSFPIEVTELPDKEKKYEDTVCELIRYIRNACSHLKKFNEEARERCGYPTKFFDHLKDTFPYLLISVYDVIHGSRCKYDNDQFEMFYQIDPQQDPHFEHMQDEDAGRPYLK